MKIATAMFFATLEYLEHSTPFVSESQSHALHSSSEYQNTLIAISPIRESQSLAYSNKN
jgi:hypothetical protein